MENDTTIAKQGLLEPVSIGSVTFENSILSPLRNSYLYEESKECFSYNSAFLINNATIQRRYSAYRDEKRMNGYSEEELEESFGFLLFDDKSRANRLADTGLIIGQGTCTILGDCSKGVYISKYSDCLDLKRWYDGKKGYIVLLKLTKGRVKEVTENYTQNFTPPTVGFDCHVSEQLREVCATTSSFLAFERTQYYVFEHLDGGSKVEPCPRHVYPFAVVAFSYGKTAVSLKKKSQEKTSFHYQPWRGHLKIGSLLYTIGLKSTHGAMFPANLPKTVQVSHAIGVSELRKTLPQAIFETSLLGEVSLDGRWFSLYDVVSFEGKNDLALLIQELKEKDMAIVVHLKDSGFLVLLHSSNFLSYEGAGTDKALSFQGMFIFPDSRTVPRETKREHKDMVPAEILQILPALNYAELEMEKCPPKQQEGPLGIVEKHLQNFAALIFPELSNSPGREASMFPDQYDVPDGFPLIAPKWTSEAGAHLKTYLGNPQSFQIPVSRALELLASGKQQHTDDHDDDVYYYISSPEEAPQTPAEMVFERDLTSEPDQITISNNDSDELIKQQAEKQKTETIEQPHCTLSENIRTPGTAVVATTGTPVERTAPSPKSGDLPMEHYVNTAEDGTKASEGNECSAVEVSRMLSNGTPIQTTNVLLSTKTEYSASYVPSNTSQHHEPESNLSKKVDCMPAALSKVTCEIFDVDKDDPQGTSPLTSISSSTSSANQIEDNKDVQLQTNSNDLAQTNPKCVTGRQGKRRKKKVPKRNVNTVQQIPTPQDTTPSSCKSIDSTPEQSINNQTTPNSLNRNWRSLPRQKKLWKTDENLRRTLRSDVKYTHTQPDANTSDTEKNTTLTELTASENIVASTPKRKMEKFSMRERYGLKTIITDCGRVFVPHGSEIATEDAKTNEGQNTFFVTNSPTLQDMACPLPLQTIPVSPVGTVYSFERMTEKSDENTEQLLDSGVKPTLPEKLKSKKDNVYKAISISKLKTVLKRARRTHSPGTENQGKSKSDHAEPEPKNPKPNVLPELTESQASSSSSSSSSSQGKLISKIPKENGCSIFYSPSPFELVKQVDQQLISTFIGDRVGGKYISSDGKSSADGLTIGVSVPSDALNLLADLALSVNSDKTLPNLGVKPRQETHLGASPKSVLHNLLRGPDRLKLPAKSPYPEGLVVTGDLILEISKEHSYSQPNSLLSGLTGTCIQVQPPVGSVESHLALHSLTLPDHASSPVCQDNKGKNGWSILVEKPSLPKDKAEKVRRFEFLQQRHVIEKDDLIQVTRYWKENYDFRFDSKFTNEKLDKCVTRALHGHWDFNFEDTYEQVHLIFHMWIGLFYSKPTSRFFHFDHNCPPLKQKDLANVLQTPVPTSLPLLNIDLCSKEGNSSTLQPLSGALDLSAKLPVSVEHHSVSQSSRGETPGLISGMRSRLMHSKDYKEPAVEANLSLSSSVQAHVTFMEYRTKVDVLDKNSVPDNESSDLENDTTNTDDNSYTELLVNNSAYNQLCGQTSNLSIDELKLLNTQTNVLDCKDQGTSQALMVEKHEKSTTDPSVAVTRRATRSFRPAILSKTRVSQRKKVIIKMLHFKYKSKNEANMVVSKDEEGLKENNKSSSFLVPCHDDKDESAFKTQAMGSSSDNVPLCLESGENYNMEIEACSSVSTPTEGGGVQEKPVCIDRNKPISNDFEDTSIFELDENNKEMDEVEPMNDDSSRHDVRNGASIKTEVHKTTGKVTPRHDVENQTPADTNEVEVRDDTPVNLKVVANDEQDEAHFKHDASIDSAVDVQNLNNNTTSKDNRELHVENMSVQDLKTTNIEANPKLDVGDYTEEAVQDVNCEESNKVKSKLDVTEHSSTVEQQDVDDSPTNETGLKPDVTDCSLTVKQQVVDDSPKNETGPGLDITDCSTMIEEQNMHDGAKNEIVPGLDDTNCSPTIEEKDVDDGTKSRTRPGLDVTDYSAIIEQRDVDDDTKSETGLVLDVTDFSSTDEPQGVDDRTKSQPGPALDFTDCSPMIEQQDVDDSAKSETDPGLDITNCSSVAEEQDMDYNKKMKTGPELDVIDCSSLDEQQDVMDVTKNKTETPVNVKDRSFMDELQNLNLSTDYKTECKLITDHIPVVVQDFNETEPKHDADCTAVNVHRVIDGTNSETDPKLDVTDQTPVDVQDVNDGIHDETKTKLDVGQYVPMNEQDVTFSLNDETDSNSNVEDDILMDVHDVNRSTNNEMKPVLDIRDCSSQSELQDSDTSGNMTASGIIANATEERKLKRDESDTEDVTAERESREEAELPCNNTGTTSEEQKMINESSQVFSWEQDWTDCVDMDISDDQDSEDETQDEVNVFHDETVTQTIKRDTISQEGGIRTQTSMVVTEEEHTKERSRQELAMDISAAQVSSADQQLILLKEGDHSPAIGGMSSTIQNEITMLDNALMDQHDIPKVNQDTATIMPLYMEDIILEPHGMTDSNHWASASATDDSSILNVNSKPTKERDDSSEKQTQRDRSPSVPTVCKVTETINDHGIQEVSPPGLQMYTEPDTDSRNVTPTKDELPFDQDFHEGSWYQEVNVQYSHSSKMMHHGLNRSNTRLALDNSEARASTSLGHRAQTSHVPFWPRRQYDSTVKPSDEYVSKENSLHFDYGDMFLPRDLVYKETESQMDQFCSFSESHNYDSFSEVSLSWTNELNFQTDGLQRLEKSYTHDDDLHFSVSVHESETNRPKEIRDTPSDVRNMAHYSDSSESKEKVHSFRHRSDLFDLNDEVDSRGSESFCYITKKRKKRVCQNKWDESDDSTNYSVRKTFLCGAHQTRIGQSSPYERKNGRQPFDWRRYFRREGVFESNEGDAKPFHGPPSSIVTMFDKKGNRVVFEKYSKRKQPIDTLSSVGKPFCNVVDQQAKLDITQSLMELEYLIFSEKMTHLLKQGKTFPKAQSQSKPKVTPVENPMTIKFSRLDEQDSFASFNETWPTLSKFKISVDMSDKKGSKKTTDYGKSLHLHSLFCEKNNKAACSKISDITKESAKSYHSMMSDICTGKSIPHQFDDAKRNWDTEGAACSKQSGFCSRIKKDMFDNLHVNLNAVVRQACKIKYRFYILVTSADLFFDETKNLLEAEGHTAVTPYEFDLEINEQAPLLIILRNEDIAEHICEVPHLLELKKSPRVLFAGVDQPDDVINLTHQELFAKGGFVVFDENALVTLNLDNMKKMVAIMEELDKKAKWKWFLHYRDSRKFREDARCSPEAQREKQFMDCCQEAGIVEVLPYHECDIISQERPGYLQCLVRLQIHNVSARFPVFITDTPDDTFEKNGILTMNIYTFLRIISHETCSVS